MASLKRWWDATLGAPADEIASTLDRVCRPFARQAGQRLRPRGCGAMGSPSKRILVFARDLRTSLRPKL